MSDLFDFELVQSHQSPQDDEAGRLSRGYATRADWNRNFNTIKRLYVDEDKTLKEVMEIMARDYNHRGT